jgi:ribosomal protein S18 acetylase RimI-like enzyme
VRRIDEVRRGSQRLRVGPWRGDHRIALLAPLAGGPPTPEVIRDACDVLTGRGYREVLTGALATTEQQGFLSSGFTVRDELHLLTHDLLAVPAPPAGVRLRRGARRDRPRALAVDGLAFPGFWRLDDRGFLEAMTATHTARFRVALLDGSVAGYCITGRAGSRGYLQRLAVAPALQGRGLGRALVVDALRWLARRHATQVVVNTQVGNERALALYQALGFRLQPTGLAVLGRHLVPEPA